MKVTEIEQRVEEVLAQMSVEELELKIAPVDCNKKPTHPDCQVYPEYGVPVPMYGVPNP